MRAAFDGYEDLSEILLQACANLYATNLRGDTAMSLAINKGHRRVAAILCNIDRTNLKLDETE
jgi:ankyrin repeat protein